MHDKEQHLAIASVPVQGWGKIYDENEAIIPLHLPAS